MTREGFGTDLKTAMLFFRFCRRYGIDKLEDRVKIMREVVRRKRVTYLRDVDEYMIGKNVLVVKKEKKNESL